MMRELFCLLPHVTMFDGEDVPCASWDSQDDGLALDSRTVAVLALGEYCVAHASERDGLSVTETAKLQPYWHSREYVTLLLAAQAASTSEDIL